jgi:hypothetical protein
MPPSRPGVLVAVVVELSLYGVLPGVSIESSVTSGGFFLLYRRKHLYKEHTRKVLYHTVFSQQARVEKSMATFTKNTLKNFIPQGFPFTSKGGQN